MATPWRCGCDSVPPKPCFYHGCFSCHGANRPGVPHASDCTLARQAE